MSNFITRLFSSNQADPVKQEKDVKTSAAGAVLDMPTIVDKFLIFMENVGDDYLPSGQELYEFIETALKDPDIETELDNFYSLCKSSRIQINPANDSPESIKAVEVIQEVFNENLRDDFISKSIKCVQQGFSVLWQKYRKSNNSKYPFMLEKFQEEKFTHFDFLSDGTLCSYDGRTVLRQANWIVTTYRESEGDRHGRSVLLTLYWVLKFQKLTYKQLTVLQDKLGVPSFAALLDPSGDMATDKKRVDAIASTLSSVRSHTGIALTARDIKKLEAQGGAIKEMMEFIRFLDEKKVKVIMGALLTSGTTGNSGTYNLAENHANITNEKAESVMKIIAQSISNTIIPMICRLNISNDFKIENMPLCSFVFDRYSSLEELVLIGEKLPDLRVKAKTIKDIYKIPIENDDDEELTFKSKDTGNQFSNFADSFFLQKRKEMIQQTQTKN